MSTSTAQRPTISITDSTGIERSSKLIEGQTLEEYFNAIPELKVPAVDEVAVMNGFPIGMDHQVPAGGSVIVGKKPRNG